MDRAALGPRDRTGSDDQGQFLVVFAYGRASELELSALEESETFHFHVMRSDPSAAVIEVAKGEEAAIALRLGGAYKIARVLGSQLGAAVEQVELPDSDKFNWSLSAYGIPADLYDATKDQLSQRLKREGLGKAKFLLPKAANGDATATEPEVEEVYRRIIAAPRVRGIDFVAHNGIGGGAPIFAETVALSDVQGFYERDFKRPFQDPRMTISPRLARLMVNISTTKPEDGDAPPILLDPFCGLGTIVAEALCCGFSVVAADREGAAVARTAANLEWLGRTTKLGRRPSIKVFRSEASRLASRLRTDSIDSVTTEPILLPFFERNPNRGLAARLLADATRKYETALTSIAPLVKRSRARLVFTSPVVVDSSGERHLLRARLEEVWKKYTPSRLSGGPTYPLELPTAKRRHVQRALNAYRA